MNEPANWSHAQRKKFNEYIESMDDGQVLEQLQEVLDADYYESDDFTEMLHDFLDYDELSDSQMNAAKICLRQYGPFWW